MAESNNEILLTTFTAVEGAHAFSAFMPSYFTVKKFAGDDGDIERLRSGYRPAILFNLALGLSVSMMTKSSYPIIASLAVIVFMLVLYEKAIPGGDLSKAFGGVINA